MWEEAFYKSSLLYNSILKLNTFKYSIGLFALVKDIEGISSLKYSIIFHPDDLPSYPCGQPEALIKTNPV